EEFGEAPIQILESKRYEYEFSKNEYQLEATKECIPSKNKRSSRGIIAPGNYVGTLELSIINEKENLKTHLEVLATKFDAANDYDKSYRENYRSMIEDITDKCTELLMQSNSPVNQYFEPDFSQSNKTLYQKFSFVKSILNKEEFEECILRIFSSPKTTWVNKEEHADIRSLKRFTNKNIKELLRGANRIPLPEEHYLSKTTILKDVPTKINSYKQEPSLDNPENRFIKHTLKVYLQFCEDCSAAFESGSPVKKEADFIASKLEHFLNHSFFKEISRPTTLKLNSPTLQRKSGYRQILKSWLMFDLASKLSWTGGEDVYNAGKRDIATLYEYWLFFVLYDLFKAKFKLSKLTHEDKPYAHLFEKTKNGLNLIIKSGEYTALQGSTIIRNRALNIKFSFNRTFSGSKDGYPNPGSWTMAMRPDYTLSVWPKELDDVVAEKEEQIVHIHFDAKYKVNHFKVKTNEDNKELTKEEEQEELNKIKTEERSGKFKNADLLKMHAYKDAIRRTGGAYILYPGNKEARFKGFHELIPGLGAFALNPNNEDGDVAALSKFIDEVVYHLVNRASQRENIAAKTYEITKDGKSKPFNEPIPEYLDGRKLIPDEVHVLVGFYNSEEQYDWIKKGNYNFRMGSGNGSLVLDKETISAKYLLLHTHGEKSSGDLWRITSKGPKVFSRLNLEKKGYPKAKNDKDYQKHYLVIDIEKVESKEFENKKWSLKKFKSGRTSAYPFTTTLRELMSSN
ncbi:MAG TPA: hypothetical protein DEG69_13435, partial [Flavobacteriaceae bacterium]|nr:hypothetical protein [Flavobacteriaceae bacterium]